VVRLLIELMGHLSCQDQRLKLGSPHSLVQAELCLPSTNFSSL
jgi:hypothetical protein